MVLENELCLECSNLLYILHVAIVILDVKVLKNSKFKLFLEGGGGGRIYVKSSFCGSTIVTMNLKESLYSSTKKVYFVYSIGSSVLIEDIHV